MLSKLDKAIISMVSRDIPLVKEPFKHIAQRLVIEQGLLIRRLRAYKKKGLMRKFSATLNHRKIGFRYNAMVVWNIPGRAVNKAGKAMASYAQVSHCYQRKTAPGWNYNLYAMIHGRTKEECLAVVRDISKRTSCNDYRILFSSKEYKKTPIEFGNKDIL